MPEIKSKKLVAAVIFLILLVLFLIFKLSGGVLVFSYLKPTYLPPGISIKSARVTATKADVFTELNFRTEDWVYGMQQSKAQNMALPATEGNYDANSTSFTCSLLVSPRQQRYRLCHSVDYGKISRYEVTQLNGSTLITSAIPTTTDHVIETKDIGKFVDSFKRTPRLFTPTFRHDGP